MNPDNFVANNTRTCRASLLRAAYYLFLIGGIVGLTYVGYVFVDARTYQTRERNKFEAVRITNVSEYQRPVIDGEVMGEMEVARLGLKAIVIQGDSPAILRRAVGHLPGTAFPGKAGNVALAGHRDTFFRPLRNIRPGDAITFKTLDGEFRYRVESTDIVPPSDVSVLQASGGRTLTLITCFPFYYVGSAPDRFIVRAREIETWQERPRAR